jgi:hypothetical protein
MKKLLALLLLIPTLCFARIGDSEQTLTQNFGQAIRVTTFTNRAQLLTFHWGKLFAVVGMLDGRSVIESYFSSDGSGPKTQELEELLASYGEKWIPVKDEPNVKSVVNEQRTVIISMGPAVGKGVQLDCVVTIQSMLTEGLLQEMEKSGVKAPTIQL